MLQYATVTDVTFSPPFPSHLNTATDGLAEEGEIRREKIARVWLLPSKISIKIVCSK